MIWAAKGKIIPLPKMLNHSTGKASNWQIRFNNITWGKMTCSYVRLITKNLLKKDNNSVIHYKKFNKIITSAFEFVKKSHHVDDTVIDVDVEEDLDEHTQLVDISDSDEEYATESE
jgi:hypothetical protein